jgi:pimeloyl-ACP methyl ester carboxylesterase
LRNAASSALRSRRGWRWACSDDEANPPDPHATNIVLVHGIFDNGAIFRRLVDALTRAGHRCWVPALKPADGRTGIRDLAAKLHAYIDRHLGTDAELALVGFSMGCIVSRHYLQMLGGVRRTKAFFAIGAAVCTDVVGRVNALASGGVDSTER